LRILGAVLWTVCFVDAAIAAEPLDIVDIRHWSYESYTRVVVELTGPVETEVRQLGAAEGLPHRLYLDLPEVVLGGAFPAPIPVTDGLLQRLRVGQNAPDRARLVVDLERYGRHRLFVLSAPDRVVLDVYADKQAGVGTVSKSAPGDAATRTPAGTVPLPIRTVHTVVIDPGHGGDDPGASGRRGLREKDLALAVGLDLRKRLIARGFQVVMTRDSDETLSLEERTAIAEGAGADVFVSVHANAADGPKANGLETYYLDESHERHTLRVASRESGVSPAALDPLQRAMAGLRVEEVSVRSAALATSVHGEMVSGVRKVYGSVRDLGVKQGPFHVLFLSGAPAILVEMGFVTHRTDAKRLDSGLYRAVMAERIARGVSHYRSTQSRSAQKAAVVLTGSP
jgi:N-acetylmuramoyl-L-alanine amidase